MLTASSGSLGKCIHADFPICTRANPQASASSSSRSSVSSWTTIKPFGFIVLHGLERELHRGWSHLKSTRASLQRMLGSLAYEFIFKFLCARKFWRERLLFIEYFAIWIDDLSITLHTYFHSIRIETVNLFLDKFYNRFSFISNNNFFKLNLIYYLNPVMYSISHF